MNIYICYDINAYNYIWIYIHVLYNCISLYIYMSCKVVYIFQWRDSTGLGPQAKAFQWGFPQCQLCGCPTSVGNSEGNIKGIWTNKNMTLLVCWLNHPRPLPKNSITVTGNGCQSKHLKSRNIRIVGPPNDVCWFINHYNHHELVRYIYQNHRSQPLIRQLNAIDWGPHPVG
jgi:hypothetical protein